MDRPCHVEGASPLKLARLTCAPPRLAVLKRVTAAVRFMLDSFDDRADELLASSVDTENVLDLTFDWALPRLRTLN